MSDEIRRLSDELARDPASLVFVPLGEALRRRGSADLALKVALRGLERHPYHADGHDLVARIAVDRGEIERAHDEWDMALRLAPGHVGALKGLGFLCFQQARLDEAERHLGAAVERDPYDPTIAAALERVRRAKAEPAVDVPPSALGPRPSAEPEPEPELPKAEVEAPSAERRAPGALFADLLSGAEGTALLLDADGLVLAGAYQVGDGQDVAQEVGAALSGVTDEAARATRHLDVGAWSSITFETDYATVSMAPSGDGLVLLATSRATPLGLVRRLLDRCSARAAQFLGEGR